MSVTEQLADYDDDEISSPGGDTFNGVLSKKLGLEIRHVRESMGWSRGYMCSMLPCRIGDRTLLSYEQGTRQLTVNRLVEICAVLGREPDEIMGAAVQKARIHLENLNMKIDLRAVLRDNNPTYRPMVQWARNCLNKTPSGITELTPAAVRALADLSGFAEKRLANYLAEFRPSNCKPKKG